MQAVVQKRYGTPEVLMVEERPAPEVGPEQIRIRVAASPITQGDRRIRAGDFGKLMALLGRLMMGFTGPRAEVPGSMFAGTVEAVGDAVTRYAVGDRVFGCSMNSAMAELLVMPQDGAIAHIPEGTGFATAAAAPYGAGTAHYFLAGLAALQPGEKLLVIGATGGVGRAAVQLGRHLGAEVTAVCRGTHRDLAERLGAHHVVDRTRQDYRALTGQYDVIFDTSGTARFSGCLPLLTAHGRFMTLDMDLDFVWAALRTRFSKGPRALSGICMDTREDMVRTARFLEEGVIKPVIAAQRPMAEIQDAHRLVEARAAVGTVVVEVSAAAQQTEPPTSSPRASSLMVASRIA